VLEHYPSRWLRAVELRDGTPLILRPIKPEDEPAWCDMLGSCSRMTLFRRFHHIIRRTPDVARRFCHVDYVKEMTVVAELNGPAHPAFIGSAMLAADPKHEGAEYAVLVIDAWQGRGLGGLLTDYCLEMARDWGVQWVVGETTADNTAMLHVLEKRGFVLEVDPDNREVHARKKLWTEVTPSPRELEDE